MPFALVEESGRVAQVEPTEAFELALPFRWVPCGGEVEPEWTFQGGRFTPPPPIPEPPVPQWVTPYQFRAALLEDGLLSAVDPAIAALPEGERQRAELAWQWETSIGRQSPFVQTLGIALGLDNAALDALFKKAAAQ